MWAALVVALGCAPEAPPGPVSAPPPSRAPPTQTWRRTGSTASGVTPAGAERIQSRCGGPCEVESWHPEPAAAGAAPLLLVVEGDRLWLDGHRGAWRTRWRSLSGTLALCLGDPLATPPAGDPGGHRLLHQRAGEWRWSVHLSGANVCGLSGHLELDALGDRVRAHALQVGHLSWAEGGREAAAPTARGLARAAAEARWPTADAAERAEILAALSKDPEASALVLALQAQP